MKKTTGVIALMLALGMTASVMGEEPAVKRFSIQCGDLVLKFDGGKYWNPNRIDFAGKNVAIEKGGVHYGAVARFKGDNGFIGSGAFAVCCRMVSACLQQRRR